MTTKANYSIDTTTDSLSSGHVEHQTDKTESIVKDGVKSDHFAKKVNPKASIIDGDVSAATIEKGTRRGKGGRKVSAKGKRKPDGLKKNLKKPISESKKQLEPGDRKLPPVKL